MKTKSKVRKILGVLAIGALLAMIFSCVWISMAKASTIYVPDDYSMIQEAVDNANDGDTIIVRKGTTYHENVIVDKSITLRGIDYPIVEAGGERYAIKVTADGCVIDGFYVTGATEEVHTDNGIPTADETRHRRIAATGGGIIVYQCENNVIKNNIASNNGIGIDLHYSSNNVITDNDCNSNSWHGINLGYLSNNVIKNNDCSNNGGGGIDLFGSSDDNRIIENTILGNSRGIGLWPAWPHGEGIGSWESPCHNTIANNIISSDKHGSGITLSRSSNHNTIANNIIDIKGHYSGIRLNASSYNTITNNTISNSGWNGIRLNTSSNNVIYLNNLFDNYHNVYSRDSANAWKSPEKITYTYNDNTYTNYLGNYYDDYTGIDADGDGIGDTPYNIDGDEDDYPLMKPFGSQVTSTPTPTILPYPTNGPLEVNFVKKSSWWEFWNWWKPKTLEVHIENADSHYVYIPYKEAGDIKINGVAYAEYKEIKTYYKDYDRDNIITAETIYKGVKPVGTVISLIIFPPQSIEELTVSVFAPVIVESAIDIDPFEAFIDAIHFMVSCDNDKGAAAMIFKNALLFNEGSYSFTSEEISSCIYPPGVRFDYSEPHLPMPISHYKWNEKEMYRDLKSAGLHIESHYSENYADYKKNYGLQDITESTSYFMLLPRTSLVFEIPYENLDENELSLEIKDYQALEPLPKEKFYPVDEFNKESWRVGGTIAYIKCEHTLDEHEKIQPFPHYSLVGK